MEFKISKRVRDLSGQRFGKLIAIKQIGYNKWHQAIWYCQCDCGGEHNVVGSELTRSNIRSCGCLLNPHGHSTRTYRSPTYTSWQNMKDRCTNPGSAEYHRYGARGIAVCDRWRDSFEAFLSDMGERPEGKTLDRIDNSKGYNPSNCQWSTPKEQAQNRNNHRGEQTPSSKLTTEQVIAIKNDPRSSREIANDYPIQRQQVERIKRGERWAHIKV